MNSGNGSHRMGWLSLLGNVLATAAFVFWLSLGCQAGKVPADAQTDASLREASDYEQLVGSDTDALMSAAARPSERTLRQKALLEIAERREAAMMTLMENAPSVALEQALPTEVRDQLPPEVRDHVEELVALEGVLEVLGFVTEDGQIGIERYLDLGDNKIRLFADDLSDDYVTGTRVSVRGLRLGDRMAASKTGLSVLAHEGHTHEGEPDGAGGVSSRYALVININFSDLPTQPWSIATATNVFTNLIPAWYTDVSYEQFSFFADVAGWYTIAASSRTCSTSAFLNQAIAAANADGYPVSSYNNVVVAFPRVAACGWAGLAQISGRYSWLNNAMNRGTAVHELGHNLGLYHSHSRRCTTGPLTGTCTTSEYGDRFDVMGRGTAGGTVSYHGAYKTYLRWIPDSDIIYITPDMEPVVVAIISVEYPSGPRVLRVARPGRTDFFSIEMREPIGADAPLVSHPSLATGVAVYLGSNMRNQSIVDVAYTTADSGDSPLQVGDTLYDPLSALNITPLLVEGGVAFIYVSYLP